MEEEEEAILVWALKRLFGVSLNWMGVDGEMEDLASVWLCRWW